MTKFQSTTVHSLLVDDITSELRNSTLVVVQLPQHPKAAAWREEIGERVATQIAPGQLIGPIEVQFANNDIDTPDKIIRNLLGALESSTWDEAIENFSLQNIPLFISIDIKSIRAESWYRLLENLSKAYARVNNPDTVRPMLFFTLGLDLRARVRGQTGLKIFDFWNIYPPTDLRSLSHRILSVAKTNPFQQVWKESSFTAAANGDRQLLEIICSESPNTLDEIFKLVLIDCNNISTSHHPEKTSDTNVQTLMSTIFKTIETGQVPAKLKKQWEAGCILGLTATGGAQISWHYLFNQLNKDDLRKYLIFLIWQEQVVGFFPLLIRLSSLVAQNITKTQSDAWTRYLPDEYKGSTDTVEPGLILSTFGENRDRLGKLPKPLLNLLHSLRIVRNKLAHTEAIDCWEVNNLWEQYSTPRLQLID